MKRFVLLMIALAACKDGSGRSESGSHASDPLAQSLGTKRLLLTGELETISAIDVQPPTNTSVELVISYFAKDGTFVKTGDVLVEFDKSGPAGRVKEAKQRQEQTQDQAKRQREMAKLTVKEKTLALQKVQKDLEKAKLEANVPADTVAKRTLQEKQLLLAQAEDALRQAEQDAKTAEKVAGLDIAVADVDAAKARRTMATVEKSLAEMTVRAPADGIFNAAKKWDGRMFAVGDQVWPSWPLGKIANNKDVQVTAWLSDIDDDRIKVGDDVTCELDAFAGKTYQGTVKSRGMMAQELTDGSSRRGFRVVISLAQPDETMRAGMSVKVVVPVKPQERAAL